MKRISDVWDNARWLGINVICILKGKREMKEENIQTIIANVFFKKNWMQTINQQIQKSQ